MRAFSRKCRKSRRRCCGALATTRVRTVCAVCIRTCTQRESVVALGSPTVAFRFGNFRHLLCKAQNRTPNRTARLPHFKIRSARIQYESMIREVCAGVGRGTGQRTPRNLNYEKQLYVLVFPGHCLLLQARLLRGWPPYQQPSNHPSARPCHDHRCHSE